MFTSLTPVRGPAVRVATFGLHREAVTRAGAWQAVLVALLLGAAWLVTDHFPPWTGFHAELPAVLAGGVAVMYAVATSKGRVSPFPAVLLLLAAVPWIQRATGLVLYNGDAALASSYLAGTALCFWAGESTSASVRQRMLLALAWATLVVSILSTGIGLYQWFGLEGLEIWGARVAQGSRTAGNLAQSNHLATLLAFGIASAVWLRARERLGDGTTFLTVAFLLLGLGMTQSRTVWLGFLTMAVWMALRPAQQLRPLRLKPGPVLWLAAWYALVLWAVVVLPEPLLLTESVPGTAARFASSSGRQVMWASWARAIEMSPWVGHGWQQGHLAQGVAAVSALAYAYSGYAHSVVLDVLAWNGLPLGITILAAATWWYVRSGLRAEGPDQWLRFAVLTVFGTHALLEYPHAYAYFLVPVALLAGQMVGDGPAVGRVPMPRWLLGTIALGCLAFAAATVHDYLLIEEDVRVLRAQKLRIGGVRTSEAPRDIVVLDQMQALMRALRVDAHADMAPGQLDELVRVAHRFPMRHLLQESAAALALNGRAAQAREEMQRLYGMYGKAGYALSLASLKEQAARTGPALRGFVEAIEADGPPPAH